MLKTLIAASAVCLMLGTGAAAAQTAAAPATAAPAGNAKAATTGKSPVSKACSDQANAKGLHGKERKKFRSECKKNGGKAS
jgi:hypothetical protein